MRTVLAFRTNLPVFTYHRPSSLAELLELKAKLGKDAAILAGGTDLLVDMKMGVKRPPHVIDIKGIKELHVLEYRDGSGLIIGPTVTLRELETNGLLKEKYPVLWDAVRKIADVALRERATLAGNIANASPAADSAPALLVYDAKVELTSVNGSRLVPLREFFTGVKKTIMKEDEVITKIIVPEPPAGAKGEYFKAVRSAEDLALVGIAALVANPNNPAERVVRLAYASVAPTPVYVKEVEELFKKDEPLNKLIKKAVNIVLSKVSPISDVRSTREYRLHLVKYVTAYLLRKLLGVK